MPLPKGQYMKYPVIIHATEDGREYGLALPDIPGVISGGGSIEECLVNVQEAVEMVCEAKGLTELPPASPMREVMESADATGGWVMPAEIDPSFLSRRAVRISLSVPEYLISRIDRKAHAAGMTRSAYMVHSSLA